MYIEVYEKTYTHCSQCEAMATAFDKWRKVNQGADIGLEIAKFSAEENLDYLHHIGATQAPVWIIDYEDGSEEKVIVGKREEDLIDALNSGLEDVW